jgi:hypothetical protein
LNWIELNWIELNWISKCWTHFVLYKRENSKVLPVHNKVWTMFSFATSHPFHHFLYIFYNYNSNHVISPQTKDRISKHFSSKKRTIWAYIELRCALLLANMLALFDEGDHYKKWNKVFIFQCVHVYV